MTDLQTPREYLFSLGLAKMGRGKFSAAAHDALAKAVADGMQFKDVTVVKAPVAVVTKSDNNVKPVKTETVKVSTKPADRPNARIVDGLMVEAAPRYMHDNYIANDIDDTKIKKTWKDTCNGCGYSIRWCLCASGPSVFSLVDLSTSLRLATVGKVSA